LGGIIMKLKRIRSNFTGEIREVNVIAEGSSETGKLMILVKSKNPITNKDMYVIYRKHPPTKSFMYVTTVDSSSSIPKGQALESFALELFNKMAKNVRVYS
jgi:hypothetical protein